jgi:hypothetical protein
LFKSSEGLIAEPNPEAIAEGAELGDGTCIVRSEGATSIYLVTAGEMGIIRRHLIVNWESMVEFGFDEAKTITVPSLVIEGLPWGRDLSSLGGRRFLTS